MYYLYILHSAASDIYYIGHTDDPWRRVVEHNTKPHTTFTSKHRPWDLVTVYKVGERRSEAMKIERFIKRQKTKTIIEKLISGTELYGKLAQLVRVPHLRN